MSEEPDVLVVPAVPIVIMSATVIPSVAVIVFIIVGVLPIALLSSCPPCPRPDFLREHLARRHRSSPSLFAVVVVNVSARRHHVRRSCVTRRCCRAVIASTLLHLLLCL